MTFLLCVGFDVVDVFEVVRQKGDADLFAVCQHADCMASWRRRTKSDLCVGKQHVSYPRCYDACCGLKGTNRPGPFPARIY
jgi:hypothetical protein